MAREIKTQRTDPSLPLNKRNSATIKDCAQPEKQTMQKIRACEPGSRSRNST